MLNLKITYTWKGKSSGTYISIVGFQNVDSPLLYNVGVKPKPIASMGLVTYIDPIRIKNQPFM